MADNRTMAQMLQAPIEGYEDAIVVPPINANNFELKQPLINLVQSNKFTGRQDPHNHLRFFNKVTSTFRHPEVPNTSVKLLLFPFLRGLLPEIGYDRNLLDQFSHGTTCFKIYKTNSPPTLPSKTYLTSEKKSPIFSKNQTKPSMKHGNVLKDSFVNIPPQRENFFDKMPQEGLAIIESKSKVRYSRSRANDSRVSTDAPLSNSSPSNNSFDMQQIAASLEDKMDLSRM
ncbi:hypothetical protein Tco_1101886 [Tanacetum coccineum]